MFQEVKTNLPVDGDDYDAQIIQQIKAGALDLTTSAEIVLPGEINITRTQDPDSGEWIINDNSTIEDDLIITVLSVWCCMMIGNPPNIDFLKKTYESFKGQLRMSDRYTAYGGEDGA